MQNIRLSAGFIQTIFNSGTSSVPQPTVQITDLKKIQAQAPANQERFKLMISDGIYYQQAMLASQLHNIVKEGTIDVGSVITLNDYLSNAVHGRKIIIILNLTVVSRPIPLIGNPNPIDSSPSGPTPAGSGMQAPAPARNTVPQTAPRATPTYGSTPYVPPQNQYVPPQPARPTNAPVMHQQQQQHQPQQSNFASTNPFQAQTSKGFSDSNVHPIKSLNPYQPRWTIKARVTNKSDIKSFNTAKGSSGTLFSVDLLDAQGGEIRAIMFSEAVEQFYELFKVNEVYYISKGKLKPANKKFNSLKNEYELTLDKDSIVQLCQDSADIPRNHFSFTEIEHIQECQKDDIIDVIGIVIQTDSVETIITKANKSLQKRTVTLVDTTMRSIELTLWGTFAENPGFPPGTNPVLALKGVKVSDFKNRTLASLSSTTIAVDPDLPQAHTLRGWFDTQGGNITPHPLSKNLKSGANGEPFTAKRSDAERKTFSQIKDDSLGRGSNPDEFVTKGTVTLIKHENPIWYNACPKCGKKVSESEPGKYDCAKCNTTVDQYEPRYMIALSASDHTGSAWLNAFNDVGKTLLQNNDASTLAGMKERGATMEYEQVFQKSVFKQYKFKIRAKVETYQNVERVRCQLFYVEALDFAKESKWLIDQIKAAS